MTDTEYPYIRKWGAIMGSYEYYIQDQINEARAEGAPPNTVFRRTLPGGEPGEWVTTDEIDSPVAREQLGLEPLDG